MEVMSGKMPLPTGGFLKMTKYPEFLFLGGRLCLDFVNTEIIVQGEPLDLLCNYEQWAAWQAAAEIVGTAEQKSFVKGWGGKAARMDALARAVAFRSELRKMVGCVVSQEPVPGSGVGAINEVLRRGAVYGQLTPVGKGFVRKAHRDIKDPVDLLVPIAEDATDLLCKDDLGRVRKCGSPSCILFFYDTSRNRTRRWCSMDLCGNRAKVAAYYRRQRGR